jgi:uncharacterized protein YecT (DUF1311 family)
MRTLLLATAAALIGFALPALADDEYDACVDKGQTDMDYRICGNEWLVRADNDLNQTWKALREITSDETTKTLLDEQRAWNAYKEKSCLFWASGEYGTMGSVLSFPPCRASVIEARTTELGEYIDALKDQ